MIKDLIGEKDIITIHPDAVYTSRILKSTDLPQPRNSNKVTIINSNHGNYLIYLIQTSLLLYLLW